MTTWLRRVSILVVLAIVLAAFVVYLSTRNQTVRADDDVPVEQLTGQALGEKLGLVSVTWDEVKGDCEAFAEYDTSNNGFCLDSVVTNNVEAALLARQINGHLISEEEQEYITLSIQLNELRGSGQATQAEIDELSDQVWELQKALYAPGQ